MNSKNPRSISQNDQELEIELLAVRCQLGELAALDDLVERFHSDLWGYLLGVTADPVVAEEVLQEAWLRILRGIGRLRESKRLRPWLYSIVRRTFMDRLRLRYKEQRLEPIEEEPVSPVPSLELDWQETEALHRSLQRLSPPDRETVVLFYLRELGLVEVSEVLDIPVGTVKSRLHRARRVLRDELNKEGVKR